MTTNGLTFRSDDDVAEAIAVQHDRIDAVIRTESELGAYDLEAVRELNKWVR